MPARVAWMGADGSSGGRAVGNDAMPDTGILVGEKSCATNAIGTVTIAKGLPVTGDALILADAGAAAATGNCDEGGKHDQVNSHGDLRYPYRHPTVDECLEKTGTYVTESAVQANARSVSGVAVLRAEERQSRQDLIVRRVRMKARNVVSREEWLQARLTLLAQEKALTQAREELAQTRRQLPWVEIAEDYEFASESGVRTLAQLFEGRSQLVVQHFMYGADWQEGCKSCSFWADNLQGAIAHLQARDVSYVAVSHSA